MSFLKKAVAAVREDLSAQANFIRGLKVMTMNKIQQIDSSITKKADAIKELGASAKEQAKEDRKAKKLKKAINKLAKTQPQADTDF